MASLFYTLLLILMISSSSIAQYPPSPGYSPSSKASSIGFDQGFRNRWGPQHQRLDQGTLTIWLDSYSGHFLNSSFNPLFFSNLYILELLHILLIKIIWR